MKICIRCNGRLSAVAKCAGSEVCSTCAATSGELSAVPLLPLASFSNYREYIDRVHVRLIG